jgi:hypothetical protein
MRTLARRRSCSNQLIVTEERAVASDPLGGGIVETASDNVAIEASLRALARRMWIAIRSKPARRPRSAISDRCT